ncbi:carcinine hydrolase/isopenicillin-N N-acyltransferase family protein [Bremerella sp. JC770]|uniref:carcinine hydrolase/isopenicillin-N N-acyltransferase family protein n=1 Tax=Bremerella sp. JC770 TaxID=3232137 RepID=UPI0034594548
MLVLCGLLFGVHEAATACTTAVVSGKVTPDGRPLLWKNRDFWQPDNEVVYSNEGKYALVGIANAEATRRLRMGTNVAGLCIENSTSRDLGEAKKSGLTNGDLITMALETCATVDDVRALLEATNAEGRRTRGNFGVIDAHGGAMMFEVGPNSYQVFDANNPQDAPNGFVVRSNFSETARNAGDEETALAIEDMYSGERYYRAHDLCLAGKKDHRLDLKYMMHIVCRDVEGCADSAFQHPADEVAASQRQSFLTQSTLNRNMTVSAAVFQGVSEGEDPRLTTMWAFLGEPLFSIAVPCWATQGEIAECLNGEGSSALCDAAVQLRRCSYDSSGARLQTKRLNEITQALRETEVQSISRIEKLVRQWRDRMPERAVLVNEHRRAAQEAMNSISSILSRLSSQTNSGNDTFVEKGSLDFCFEDPNGTRLARTENSASQETWNGGMTDCRVEAGVFRIRRNSDSPVTRYVAIEPSIRVRGNSQNDPFQSAGWLVVDIAGWNIKGSDTNESIQIGFSSRPDDALHTAAFRIERSQDGVVAIGGKAFGDGGTSIDETVLPAYQPDKVTLVLELDKVQGNPDEGDFGGEYRIFMRHSAEEAFQQIGRPGRVRRLRNGNAIHFQVAGDFADDGEFFDIDRIFYTTNNPMR